MYPWESGHRTNDMRNCFGNANYNDEALKKCVNLETFYDWLTECDCCCNRDICGQYAEKPEIKITFDTESIRPAYLDYGSETISWSCSNDNMSFRYI